MSRPLDHLVLAARDLDGLAATYRDLGFQVGGRNRHPWGTENHIVQLEGTFLELIGLADGFERLGDAEAAAPFANGLADFVARRDGLALVALRSTDPVSDVRAFEAAGIGSGTLTFRRTAEAPDGTRREVAFSLAFARDPAGTATEFFTCRHHRPENFWNPGAKAHPNGATRVTGVSLLAESPVDRLDFLSRLFGQDATTTQPGGLSVDLGGASLDVISADVLADRLGQAGVQAARSGAGFAAFRLEVSSLGPIRTRLERAGSPFERSGDRIVVPPAAAGGVAISFEASP